MNNSITLDIVEDAVHRQMFGLDNPGFCKACGLEQDGCEPDAMNYECEACGEKAVCGAEQIYLALV